MGYILEFPSDRILCWILEFLSDRILFWILEGMVVGFVLLAAAKDWKARRNAGRGGATLSVKRSAASGGKFYGAYGAATAVLVAIALQVEVAKDHRVVLVLLNVGVVAYLCLLNSWFRNKLVGWTTRLSELEER